MTMFRKLALGFIAAASLSAAALAPTAASAKPFGWGGGWGFHHHHIGLGLGFGVVDSGCYVNQLVATPLGPRYRTINVCAY
jgi:hypothetical protein